MTLSIQFFGAAGEVTGSCHLVTVGQQRILLDCGLIQCGRKDEARNREPFPFDPKRIDALAWDAFIAGTGEARPEGFYGAAMLPMSELEYTGIMEKLDVLNTRFKVR
jgi:fructose 1,6-bisphosphatase